MLVPKHAFIAAALIFLGLFITNGVPYVYSDGYCYFHIARSLTDTGNFIREDRPEYFDYHVYTISEYKNKYVTVCGAGTALFWLPGLNIAKLFRTPDQSLYTDYNLAFNGHTLAEGISILTTATIVGLLTLVLLYKIGLILTQRKKLSVVLTGAVYASSYAIWYVMLNASFTHTYELFTASGAVWSYLKYKQQNQPIYLASLGAALGWITLIRPTLGVIAILFAVLVLAELISKHWPLTKTKFIDTVKDIVVKIMPLALAALPFALVLFYYNFISYGNAFSSGYNELRGETFTFSEFNGHNILFSPQRGWFIYSPIFFLAVLGLIILVFKPKLIKSWQQFRGLAIVSLLAIIANVVIYGFWPAWWAGGSYGHRFMIVMVPFGLIGLAYFYDLWKEVISLRLNYKLLTNYGLKFLLVAFTGWSLLLTGLYRFTPVAELRPPEDKVGMMQSGDRYTPLDMISYHVNLITNSGSIKNYLSELIKSARGGNSLIVLPLGIADIVGRVDERNQFTVFLDVIGPAVIRQELPEKIEYYLQNDETKDVYKGTILNPQVGHAYPIYSMDKGNPYGQNVIFEQVTDYPAYIDRREYRDIAVKKFNISVYFKNVYNFQFQGLRKNLAPPETGFKL